MGRRHIINKWLSNNWYLWKDHALLIYRFLNDNWNSYEWPAVIFVGLLSLLIGTIGFWRYNIQLHSSYTIWDCLYQSLQLFSIQGTFERNEPVPLWLEIARFLSPMVAGYTFFQALKELFQEQGLLLKLVQAQNHYIICGLGQKGILLAKELRFNNKQVVVIERDDANPLIKLCNDLGALIIIGDACDQRILIKAGILRAKHLIAVCGEDSANAEIAEKARAMADKIKTKGLICTIHIVNSYLWTLFREREFNNEPHEPVTLDFFNVYDTGARILIRETLGFEQSLNAQLHVLIAGLGDLGEYLLIHAAQQWCLNRPDSAQRLRISIVDLDVDLKLDALKLKYPLIDEVCDFTCYAIEPEGATFQKKLQIGNPAYETPVTHAYVCMDDISAGLQTGFTLLRIFQSQKINILVRLSEDTGLTSFLREVKGPDYISANLKAFGLLDRTCKIELFDDGTHESLARAIHEAYLERETDQGMTMVNNANLVPWEKLSEEARESNRRQANHIGIKLSTVSCGFMLWQDYGAEKFIFSTEEIEIMAVMEHKRWMQEKLALGWRYASQRNDFARYHPDLLDWNLNLSEEAKKKTRLSVSLIPSLLAKAGFQIYRIKKANSPFL